MLTKNPSDAGEKSKPDDTGSALDDLRRIGQSIARESGGDIQKHIAESNRIANTLKTQLGLKPAARPVIPKSQPDKAH